MVLAPRTKTELAWLSLPLACIAVVCESAREPCRVGDDRIEVVEAGVQVAIELGWFWRLIAQFGRNRAAGAQFCM